MPRVIAQTIYKFEELSERAKERARNWWRDSGGPEDFDCILSDAVEIGELIGISFDKRRVTLMGGGIRYEAKVWFSLGYRQGDYANFDGSYSYSRGAAKAVRQRAPMDKVLHSIVDQLQAAQRRRFYRITATCQSNHLGGMTVNASDEDRPYADIGDDGREVERALERFADWIYSQVRDENDYQMSDEVVDENITCNEYEFDEGGNRC